MPNFPALFRADIVRLVEASNIHKHSDTCYKYWNAKHGEKKTCRMRMPRQLVKASSIDPDSGHITMKRSDPWVNNFNEYLIAACRSNMDIKFIWSGSDAKALVQGENGGSWWILVAGDDTRIHRFHRNPLEAGDATRFRKIYQIMQMIQ